MNIYAMCSYSKSINNLTIFIPWGEGNHGDGEGDVKQRDYDRQIDGLVESWREVEKNRGGNGKNV